MSAPSNYAIEYGEVLVAAELTQSQLHKFVNASGVVTSLATINQVLKHDRWPTEPTASSLRTAMIDFATENNLIATQCANSLFESALINIDELESQMLTAEQLKFYKLIKDPFFGGINGIEDLYITDSLRYAIESMITTARTGTKLVLTAEVGAGKSVAKELFYETITREHNNIRVIELRRVDRTTVDQATIAQALLRELNIDKHPANSEERDALIEKTIEARYAEGERFVLLIDESHDLPKPIINLAKRWSEIGRGLSQKLAIVLIGQTELTAKLSCRSVREFKARITEIELPPLGDDLKPYIEHKLRSANGQHIIEQIDPAVYPLIRKMLMTPKSYGNTQTKTDASYMQAVNKLMSTLLCRAYDIKETRITVELLKLLNSK